MGSTKGAVALEHANMIRGLSTRNIEESAREAVLIEPVSNPSTLISMLLRSIIIAHGNCWFVTHARVHTPRDDNIKIIFSSVKMFMCMDFQGLYRPQQNTMQLPPFVREALIYTKSFVIAR